MAENEKKGCSEANWKEKMVEFFGKHFFLFEVLCSLEVLLVIRVSSCTQLLHHQMEISAV